MPIHRQCTCGGGVDRDAVCCTATPALASGSSRSATSFHSSGPSVRRAYAPASESSAFLFVRLNRPLRPTRPTPQDSERAPMPHQDSAVYIFRTAPRLASAGRRHPCEYRPRFLFPLHPAHARYDFPRAFSVLRDCSLFPSLPLGTTLELARRPRVYLTISPQYHPHTRHHTI